jgi:hypothetical protein
MPFTIKKEARIGCQLERFRGQSVIIFIHNKEPLDPEKRKRKI